MKINKKHKVLATVVSILMIVLMTSMVFADSRTVSISNGFGPQTSTWTTDISDDAVFTAVNTGNGSFYAKAISSALNSNATGGATRRTLNIYPTDNDLSNPKSGTANSGSEEEHYWRLSLDPFYLNSNCNGHGGIGTADLR